MKTTVSSLKKVIRKALREQLTLEEAAYTSGEAGYPLWDLAYEIAKKLMYTPYYNKRQVADQMSGGLYSRDPKFKQLVDGLYDRLEDEASGP